MLDDTSNELNFSETRLILCLMVTAVCFDFQPHALMPKDRAIKIVLNIYLFANVVDSWCSKKFSVFITINSRQPARECALKDKKKETKA